jgi:hypothetical protein
MTRWWISKRARAGVEDGDHDRGDTDLDEHRREPMAVVLEAPDRTRDRATTERPDPASRNGRERADALMTRYDETPECADEQPGEEGDDRPPDRGTQDREYDERHDQRNEDPQDHALSLRPPQCATPACSLVADAIFDATCAGIASYRR